LINISFASGKKDLRDFSIIYLFKKGNYSIYKGEKLLSDLNCLKDRKILEIRFDRNNKDSVLFAEQIDNLYRVIRLNYITNKETVLFEFEQEIYRFRAFTENTFFWCEQCEKSPEPHILYEYDSRTKQIKKLYELEDLRKSPEYGWEHRYITDLHADDNFIYFYVDGGFVGDSGYYVLNRSTGQVQVNKIQLGWSYPGARYNNKIIREGSKVVKTGNVTYWERDEKSCVIFDLTNNVLKDSLLPLVHSKYHKFSVNLGLLASKRDYLYIDKWLKNNIEELRSSVLGKIEEVNIEIGQVISTKNFPILKIIEPCSHAVQWKGMCSLCGKDCSIDDFAGSDSSRATIRMTHDASELFVSQQEAQRLEKENATREVNEKTKLLDENADIPENDKCVQTDESLQDSAVSLLSDRRNWIIIVLVLTILHSWISGGSKKN